MEVVAPEIDLDTINEMDERRLSLMHEEGINEADVLQTARDNLNIWQNYFNENIVRGKDDANFTLRDQWTAVERSEFNRLFKPAFTFNKLYDATKKIAGEQRKNKPDLIVRSLTGKAKQAQLDLRADLVRTISYQSQNDLVYQTAFRSALLTGYGAFQIDTDYESPRSFNQVITYRLIQDHFRCSFDPSAEKPHKGDGNFVSRSFEMSKDQFAATYPYIRNPVSYSDPRSLLDFTWETRNTIVICDYFVKEWYPLMLYRLSNGEAVTASEWEEMQALYAEKETLAKDARVVGDMILGEIPRIIGERQTQDYRIMRYRLTQDKIIDFSEWPSKQLPIVFVDGDSQFIEGRQYTKSFIHEAKDAQKFINYVGSEIAAEIKNRRREQWIGTPDNIIGNEQLWRTPELQSGILIARPDPKTGQLPQKLPPWDLSQQLLAQYMRGTQDIREIMGFSEAEQNNSRDISGKAKRERKLEGSMSAYVYFDNLNQAVEQGGRVVNDLLYPIYGKNERYVTLSKKDGTSKPLVLNQSIKNGEETVNQLEPGDFDVEIDTGPSFAVQKDTALELFTQTLQAYPEAFPLIADLWASQLDLQQMPTIKERFKTLVPPEILAKEDGQPPPPPKPNPQAMMLQAELQAKQQEIEIKKQELLLKQEQNKLDQAELMLKAQQIQMQSELDVYNHQADIEKSRVAHSLDARKAEADNQIKLAKIIADMRKAQKPRND